MIRIGPSGERGGGIGIAATVAIAVGVGVGVGAGAGAEIGIEVAAPGDTAAGAAVHKGTSTGAAAPTGTRTGRGPAGKGGGIQSPPSHGGHPEMYLAVARRQTPIFDGDQSLGHMLEISHASGHPVIAQLGGVNEAPTKAY